MQGHASPIAFNKLTFLPLIFIIIIIVVVVVIIQLRRWLFLLRLWHNNRLHVDPTCCPLLACQRRRRGRAGARTSVEEAVVGGDTEDEGKDLASMEWGPFIVLLANDAPRPDEVHVDYDRGARRPLLR